MKRWGGRSALGLLLLCRLVQAKPPAFMDLSGQLGPPLVVASSFHGALFGTRRDDVWVAGSRLFHYDGTRFQPGPDVPGTLADLWGEAGGSLYAVGSTSAGADGRYAGLLYRHDGRGWVRVALQSEVLHGVWGHGGTVWLVGERGTIWRGRGGDFTRVPSGTEKSLHGIFGVAQGGAVRLFIVGEEGTVLAGDGAAFTPVASRTALSLRRIWGSSAADLWIIGYDPYRPQTSVLRSDGRTFRRVLTTGDSLRALWGSGPADVWLVGGDSGADRGVVLHHDGRGLRRVAFSGDSLQAVFGLPGELWVAGCHGALQRLVR